MPPITHVSPAQRAACRDRFPFDHLTLSEVAEAQGLMLRWASRECDKSELARLSYLNNRRRCPLYTNPEWTA